MLFWNSLAFSMIQRMLSIWSLVPLPFLFFSFFFLNFIFKFYPLSITNSQSLLKLMSIASVMPSNHLILCCPLLLPPSIFPASGAFPLSQFFPSGGQSIGVSGSASVLPMNIQDWFPLGWTSWISLQSKRLSRIFSNITVQKHHFFSAQLSL